MLPPDIALALLINRTTDAYSHGQPAYMTYRERTHITVPSLHREQNIDRSVSVRVADDAAVMHDLPQGAERTGQAFPIIPYFDPFSQFEFGYFANMKRIDITLKRYAPFYVPTAPKAPAGANVTVGYFSVYNPAHAPDSTDEHLHLTIAPVPQAGNEYYPSDVVEDPQTHLPAHVELRTPSSGESIGLDYGVIEGHWVVTHGTFTAPQRAGPLSFTVVADVTYDQFEFPATRPDPRL